LLPKQPVSHPEPFDFDGDFKSTLSGFLEKLMPSGIKYQELLKFDLDAYCFSDVQVVLLPSIPETVHKEAIASFGKGKLYSVLRRLLPSSEKSRRTITYQCTSLGNLDTSTIEEFCVCCYSNFKSLEQLREDRKLMAKWKSSEAARLREEQLATCHTFNVVYPTSEYILSDSFDGPTFANCLLLSEKNYESHFHKPSLC